MVAARPLRAAGLRVERGIAAAVYGQGRSGGKAVCRLHGGLKREVKVGGNARRRGGVAVGIRIARIAAPHEVASAEYKRIGLARRKRNGRVERERLEAGRGRNGVIVSLPPRDAPRLSLPRNRGSE